MRYQAVAKLCAIVALLLAGITSAPAPLSEAQDIDLPAIVFSSPPTIPPIVLAARVSGNVVTELSLDAEGKVFSAHAVEGHPLLRKCSEQAALRWRFAPATKSARTLRLTFIYPKLAFGESAHITVLPYRTQLKLVLPEYVKPPDTETYIPLDWRPGKDRCNVHGEVLKMDRVEIVYGLIGFREGYLEAQKKLFPNAETATYGGCVIVTDVVSGEVSPKYAEVLYCRRCRIAERRWNHRNRHKKYST
jgi:hypothetical protein